jgi:hypothetical protein
VSLVDRLGRWRRAAPPAGGRRHALGHAWRTTAGDLASAVGAAAGVTRDSGRAATPPLEQICADLHRINGEIARVLADPRLPARYHRLVAASWAYDAALKDACRAVGVDPPERAPLDLMERLQTEAALTAHGVHW